MDPSIAISWLSNMASNVEANGKHPEGPADILLRWVNPLIHTANERRLHTSDVWDCPENETVDVYRNKFWKAWNAEKQHAEQLGGKPSFSRALRKAYSSRLVLSGFLQMIFMIMQLGQPFLVGELVDYIQTGRGGMSRGLWLACTFGGVSLIGSIMQCKAVDSMRRLGVGVRGGIMMAVYEQTLVLTASSRSVNTVGQMTNLIAIDAEKLRSALQCVHFLWLAPIICCVIMAVLVVEVGYVAALAGMAFLFVLVPLQSRVAASLGVTRRAMMNNTDERVKLINELLQAVRVVKLYAWEAPIEQRVREVRDQETSWLHRYLDRSGQMRELLFAAQPIAALIMFATAFYGLKKPLSMVVVVRMLAFLNITRFPLNMLSEALKNTNAAAVSIDRLSAFFCLPALQQSPAGQERVEDKNVGVHFNGANFTWDTLPGDDADSDNCPRPASSTKGELVPSTCSDKFDSNLSRCETGFSSADVALTLYDLHFKTRKPNELVAVIGGVGSGKSSFISSLLGEMNLASGSAEVHGAVSYCAQSPWIQNLTVKQNICFELCADSLSLEQQFDYDLSLSAASLTTDMSTLSHGDMTEIGERGINLSGGQKARIALARAFFSHYRSQIYLLDDPFSAIDATTASNIFQQGVVTLLQEKLRIIVLNSHMQLLRNFDRILVLENGRIVLDGTFQELFASHGDLMAKLTGLNANMANATPPAEAEEPVTFDNQSETSVVEDFCLGEGLTVDSDTESMADLVMRKSDTDDSDLEMVVLDRRSQLKSRPSNCSIVFEYTTTHKTTARASLLRDDVSVGSIGMSGRLSRVPSNSSMVSFAGGFHSPRSIAGSSNRQSQLMTAEKLDSGVGLRRAYIKYFTSSLASYKHINHASFYHKAAHHNSDNDEDTLFSPLIKFFGGVTIFFMIALFTTSQLFRIAVDIYLVKLADNSGGDLEEHFKQLYFGAFVLLLFSIMLRSVYLNYFAVCSSRVLHAQILRKVLAAPVPAFFDTHTIGTILNRFSKDMETLDVNIPEFILQLLINFFQVFSVFMLCIAASYWFALVLVPMCCVFYHIFRYFSAVSRDLKRLEAVTRSPVFSSLSETLSGLETIRAYGDTNRFLNTHLVRMNLNQKLMFHQFVCMTWMGLRLECCTAVVLFTVSIACVCLRDSVSPIALCIALSYGLQLTNMIQRFVQLLIDTVTYMTSVERVLEYLTIPQEQNTVLRADEASQKHSFHPDTAKSKEDADKNWPKEGSIVFDNVWMQYRENPAVLRGITVRIESGQRIGICGRTGAGKSSVMTALFRIVELTSGKVYIGDRDISTVPLITLRSAVAIIPQEPVLFSGSIRFQLDPFGACTDEEVWACLEQVHMAATVRAMPNGLEDMVKGNGDNLSQGQRQLLCIARALLRKAKILVVDEGTSAVDPHTDELIQHVLREEVEKKGATVLAIAHRLQTIADFDKILVLGAGQVLEYGSPKDLLQNPESVFAGMMRDSTAH